MRHVAAAIVKASVADWFGARRWVFTAAFRCGRIVGGVQTTPPWAAIERDSGHGGPARSRMLAVHVGVVDMRPPDPEPEGERWWQEHPGSETAIDAEGS